MRADEKSGGHFLAVFPEKLLIEANAFGF